MKKDYPIFRVKVIIETEYQFSNTHKYRNENIEPILAFNKEIDAVKAAIDSLRAIYNELEKDEI